MGIVGRKGEMFGQDRVGGVGSTRDSWWVERREAVVEVVIEVEGSQKSGQDDWGRSDRVYCQSWSSSHWGVWVGHGCCGLPEGFVPRTALSSARLCDGACSPDWKSFFVH